MAEAQARGPGGRRLTGRGSVDPAEAALSLDYASGAQLAERVSRAKHLLGVVAFGGSRPASPTLAGAPSIRIDMPAIDGDGWFEIWGSGQPVQTVDAHGISGARNRDLLFGCVQAPADRLEDASRSVYGRVFDFIDALGFPFLMRAWNYFPGINDEADGMERYRRFNIGRHEAFAAKGRTIGVNMPAACALGCDGGPLTVYFLAARTAGVPVENPRQVSAFDYPVQYGPRSPTFSRAMLMQPAGQRVLAISGTASVVGHETRHAGDPVAQIAETIANLRALIEVAGEPGTRASGTGKLFLKAYLRDPAFLPAVRRALMDAFREARVACLRADICRSDLLVEVEGLYFLDGRTA